MDTAHSLPAQPPTHPVEPAQPGETVRRAVLGVSPVLLVGVLVATTWAALEAQDLPRTLPNSDGDMFGFGLAAVVLAAVVLGLPVLAAAIWMGWRALRLSKPAPAGLGIVLGTSAWAALASLGIAAVSWGMVSDRSMYRPRSIERAQDAVQLAGLGGAGAAVAVGALGVLVLRVARSRR